jgi:hypothetical protein
MRRQVVWQAKGACGSRYNKVKAALLEKFGGATSAGTDVDYEETNEILGQTQKVGQTTIEEYVREALKRRPRVSPVMKNTLAAVVIKGLRVGRDTGISVYILTAVLLKWWKIVTTALIMHHGH